MERKSLYGTDVLPRPEPTTRTNLNQLLEAAGGATHVNPSTMAGLPAVYNGITIIGNLVGQMALPVYRRKPNNVRERDVNHPAYKVLKRPSPILSRYSWLATCIAHIKIHGNAYTRIDRGNPWSLEILDPTQMQVKLEPRLQYVYKNKPILPEDLLHFHGLSMNGITGESVTSLLRLAIGETISQTEYAEAAWQNGMKIKGVIKVPSADQDDLEEIKRNNAAEHQGARRGGKFLFLTGGSEIQPWNINFEDAEFLAQRQFSLITLANIIGCPFHWLGGNTGSQGYNSLTEENRSFLSRHLSGILAQVESECEAKLLTEIEKNADTHYIEFLREELLSSDPQTNEAILGSQLADGRLSLNDYLALKNLPGIGELGDKRRMPSSQKFIDDPEPVPFAPADQGEPEPEQDEDLPAKATVERIVARLHKSILNKSKRDDFASWVKDTFIPYHRATLVQALSAHKPDADVFVDCLLDDLRDELAAITKEQIPQTITRTKETLWKFVTSTI